MKPYYSDSFVTIYHGDALEMAGELPNVAVLFLDPPFFMPAMHYAARAEWARGWGDTSVLRGWWCATLDALLPHLNGSGSAFVCCDDESYPVFYPACYTRFPSLSALVWDKGRIGMGAPWRHSHEFILHCRRDGAKWRGSKGESDILRYPPVTSSARLHPVDKPLALLDKLIQVSTDVGETVLDPFVGGGSTLDAARRAGRHAIGIEIEERYCEIAAERCRQEVLDLGAA